MHPGPKSWLWQPPIRKHTTERASIASVERRHPSAAEPARCPSAVAQQQRQRQREDEDEDKQRDNKWNKQRHVLS